MDCGIKVDAPLDYATIQIFPAQNRYEVFVCAEDEVEKLACGLLEQLLPHLSGVKKLHRERTNANFKLQVAELNDKTWFTKSTLNRFLKIIASPDLVNTTKVIEAEISQLEVARKFHLSLYAEEREGHFENGETDRCSSIGTVPPPKPEVKISSSDTSKDELLKAIDLRLVALGKELAAALHQAAGLTCSPKDVRNLIDFCYHFGAAADLTNSLCKFFQLSHKSKTSVLGTHPTMCMSRNDNADRTNEDTQISRSTHLETPVKYGVSPALVAQVERQISTESDKSSYSSDENQISAERSRALSRSAQPRRSASPMRRIQIGRNGSRRAPALTIKSLGHYPGREKTLNYGDVTENSSEDEGYAKISEKPQNDVQRMSVQDAINLFERKQRDESANAQKRSSSNPSLCTNKSVLRRWSAGTTECSATCQSEVVSEDSVPMACEAAATGGYSNSSVGETLQSNFTSVGEISINYDASLKGLETREPDPVDTEKVTAAKEQKTNGISSAEWSQQKEAELNQMLTKMMDSQLTKSRKPQTSRNQDAPSKHRGGFFDHYKEKRDEKLRGENARNKAEKDARLRALQQTLDEQKAAMSSRSVKVLGKNTPSPRPQKSLKNSSQLANLRSESSKASAERKFSSRASTLSTTRKSWPSMSSTKMPGSSPSRISAGISSAATTATHRKPMSMPAVPRSIAKVERTQPRQRTVGERETNRRPNVMKEKKQHTVRKPEKRAEAKVAVAPGDCSIRVMSKPSFYNKMTKKGSVVPLEPRPFLRKGSGNASVSHKSNRSSELEGTSTNCGNMVETLEHEIVDNTPIHGIYHEDRDVTSTDDANAAMEAEKVINSCQNSSGYENIDDHVTDGNDNLKDTMVSSTQIQSQDSSEISPAAWEEMDGNQKMQRSCDGGSSQLASPLHVTPLLLSSPRVRHSLSQMLQEESTEADAIEWGNAENPPAMAYQKDAPKGLKRLLKFARKSKGDTNLTGWSSPSVFSEGEDDTEESKAITKRNTDNLSMKAALHSKNCRQHTGSFLMGGEKPIDPPEFLPAQSNMSKFGVQSSHKLNKSKILSSASTAKASRSFFSLSAFRGSKPNETKFH